jgi:5'-methylthioadenosine phosphorylase
VEPTLLWKDHNFLLLLNQDLYRSWNADVIGMTNMPEAKLAREAEIRYCTVAMVTDYDCWHPDHDEVDVRHGYSNFTKKCLQCSKHD